MQRSRTSSHSAHEGAHRAHGFRTNATSRAWHFHSGVNNRSSARGDDMRAQKIRFPLHSCIFQANPSTVPAHTLTSQNLFAARCFCPSPAARFYLINAAGMFVRVRVHQMSNADRRQQSLTSHQMKMFPSVRADRESERSREQARGPSLEKFRHIHAKLERKEKTSEF